MSRSYKKYSSVKQVDSCKWGQRKANKKVRQYKDIISNGRSYKKLFETWNICDYKFTTYSGKKNKYNRK